MLVLAGCLIASPAAAQPADVAGEAFRLALADGDVDAVIGAFGPVVKVAYLEMQGKACRKAFSGRRTVRGTRRDKLARCLVARGSMTVPASAHVARNGDRWDAEIGALTVSFVEGKDGALAVTSIAQERPGPKVAFFDDRNKKALDAIIAGNTSTNLGKFMAIKPGAGVGAGTGTAGKGTGTGGGGGVQGDFVKRSGPEPKLSTGTATGDLGQLTADEIDRVMRARAGVWRACYHKELERSPRIAGKVVMELTIDADGAVTSVTLGENTLKSEPVENCLRANAMRLRFPAKAKAVVHYPLVFDHAP